MGLPFSGREHADNNFLIVVLIEVEQFVVVPVGDAHSSLVLKYNISKTPET